MLPVCTPRFAQMDRSCEFSSSDLEATGSILAVSCCYLPFVCPGLFLETQDSTLFVYSCCLLFALVPGSFPCDPGLNPCCILLLLPFAVPASLPQFFMGLSACFLHLLVCDPSQVTLAEPQNAVVVDSRFTIPYIIINQYVVAQY